MFSGGKVLRVVSQADRTYFSGSNQFLKSKRSRTTQIKKALSLLQFQRRNNMNKLNPARGRRLALPLNGRTLKHSLSTTTAKTRCVTLTRRTGATKRNTAKTSFAEPTLNG